MLVTRVRLPACAPCCIEGAVRRRCRGMRNRPSLVRIVVARLLPKQSSLGIEPRASRMLSGCDTTTPCALRRRCCARFMLQARVGQRRPLSKPTCRETALHERLHTRWRSQGPHRLVVRTSRRGRDNPGSTPGVDIFARPGEGATPARPAPLRRLARGTGLRMRPLATAEWRSG